MPSHGDRWVQMVDFRDSFQWIKWLYLHSKCGIKTKTHFEWLLWHWSSLGQLNLEPTRPNGLLGCKVPTDLVKISVKEATHMGFYYNIHPIPGHQEPSHYLSQCWPRSMPSNGVTRSQWLNDTLYSITCLYDTKPSLSVFLFYTQLWFQLLFPKFILAIKIYVHFLQFLDRDVAVKVFPHVRQELVHHVMIYRWYHGFWWPGAAKARGIISHGIDLIIPDYSDFSSIQNGSGHGGVAVLLTCSAISWSKNQVTRLPHICDPPELYSFW